MKQNSILAVRYLTMTVSVCAVVCVVVMGAETAQAATVVSNGSIVYSDDEDGDWEIYTVNPDGSGQAQMTDNDDYDDYPSGSPDGQRVIFQTNRDGDSEVYAMDPDGGNVTNLTNAPTHNDVPQGSQAWSPDSTKFVFQSDRDDLDGEIYAMNVDGTGLVRLTNSAGLDAYPTWSPDGAKILFQSARNGGGHLWVMNADGTGPVQLTSGSSTNFPYGYSPDGSLILFTSDREGNFEVYRMNADGTNLVRLTNTLEDETYAAWSPDGALIAFSRSGAQQGIYTMNLSGSGQTFVIATSSPAPFITWLPVFTVVPDPDPDPGEGSAEAIGATTDAVPMAETLPATGPETAAYAGGVAAYGAYRIGRKRWDIARRKKKY